MFQRAKTFTEHPMAPAADTQHPPQSCCFLFSSSHKSSNGDLICSWLSSPQDGSVICAGSVQGILPAPKCNDSYKHNFLGIFVVTDRSWFQVCKDMTTNIESVVNRKSRAGKPGFLSRWWMQTLVWFLCKNIWRIFCSFVTTHAPFSLVRSIEIMSKLTLQKIQIPKKKRQFCNKIITHHWCTVLWKFKIWWHKKWAVDSLILYAQNVCLLQIIVIWTNGMLSNSVCCCVHSLHFQKRHF